MAKRILVAVIFVPLLLVIMLLLPPIVWTVVVMLISAVACFELLRAAGERKVSLPMEAVSVLSAAALPFHWRHGRKAWSTFPLVILAAFTFPIGMDGSAGYGVQLIILSMTGVLTVFGVWRWHEDEE